MFRVWGLGVRGIQTAAKPLTRSPVNPKPKTTLTELAMLMQDITLNPEPCNDPDSVGSVQPKAAKHNAGNSENQAVNPQHLQSPKTCKAEDGE